MNKKYSLLVIFLLVLFVFPLWQTHAETSNVGFVPANIWYSKDPFADGEKVKIYTVIFNPDTRQLSGTVEFFDDVLLLGKKSFTVDPKGVKDISIDWTAYVGKHEIFAKIIDAKFLTKNGTYENTTLDQNQTEKSIRTVSKLILPEGIKQDNANAPSIKNITTMVEGNIPTFISKPAISLANNLEDVRTNLAKASEDKKQTIKTDIETAKNTETSPNSGQSKGQLLKPFKYVELFFLTLGTFIFNNPFVFYGLLIVIVFFLVRYIWHLIF